ncbi:MAG: PepSY domain-containing protein, partial [Anaerolineae bacterium]
QPQTDPDTQAQEPLYTGSIAVNQAQDNGMKESDEATALQSQATITADQAKEAALAANPGTTVTKVELDNENGVLVYSVELNGLDIKVDAGNAKVLYTEQAGGDKESADNDNLQEEHGSQADDATETAGIE